MRKYLFLLLFPLVGFGQFNPIFFNAKPNIVNLNSNLSAYYNLDSNTNDQTTISPNGVGTGIDYVLGKTGNAARFDATGDKIDIASSPSFVFSDGTNDIPFSVSMWVYSTAASASGNYIINKKRASSASQDWQIARTNTGLFYFVLFDKVTNAIYMGAGTVDITPLNSWLFVTCTYDGSKTQAGLNIYINGIKKTLSVVSVGTYTGMLNTQDIVRLGAESWQTPSVGLKHQGYLEDVGVWKNRILTQSEINYLYNSGAGRTYPF